MKATLRHLLYLDELRESGVTNMFGAQPYLIFEFPGLSQTDAATILAEWMKSYSLRHPDPRQVVDSMMADEVIHCLAAIALITEVTDVLKKGRESQPGKEKLTPCTATQTFKRFAS